MAVSKVMQPRTVRGCLDLLEAADDYGHGDYGGFHDHGSAAATSATADLDYGEPVVMEKPLFESWNETQTQRELKADCHVMRVSPGST